MSVTLTALLAAIAGGCYRYVPLELTAISGRTGAPVQGLVVRTFYPSWQPLFQPAADAGVTDADGKVLLSAAIRAPGLLSFNGYALDQPEMTGYLPLPIAVYDARDAAKPIPTIPFRVRLLTLPDHREKYRLKPN